MRSHAGFNARLTAATHCNMLQQTATNCNMLQHAATNVTSHAVSNACLTPATHCNTLQHTATRYNMLQHTATCCSRRDEPCRQEYSCDTPTHTHTQICHYLIMRGQRPSSGHSSALMFFGGEKISS